MLPSAALPVLPLDILARFSLPPCNEVPKLLVEPDWLISALRAAIAALGGPGARAADSWPVCPTLRGIPKARSRRSCAGETGEAGDVKGATSAEDARGDVYADSRSVAVKSWATAILCVRFRFTLDTDGRVLQPNAVSHLLNALSLITPMLLSLTNCVQAGTT